MSVSNNFLRLGVLSALVGMSLGVWMGASENFTLSPVHAHINLLGFASMMLFGLFYRIIPAAAQGWLATVHFILAVLGFLVLAPSLAWLLLGHPEIAPVLAVGEIMLVTSMLLFTVVVFRATGRTDKPATA